MQPKSKYLKQINEFRNKFALESEEENIVLAMHLMNTCSIDEHAALDQSSQGGGHDHGIDGWYYDDSKECLYIYQSKYSEGKELVINGFDDLRRALEWVESVLIDGKVDKVPTNHVIYNLFQKLAQKKEQIKKIIFVLASLFNPNELEDRTEYDSFRKDLIRSKLMNFMENKEGKIDLKLEEYNFDTSLPARITKYEIQTLEQSKIELRKTAYLQLAYVRLRELVDLYRQRGYILFEKNVRLSLLNKIAVKKRLIHPMEETFNLICDGKTSPSIFSFYHIGVTLAAKANDSEKEDILALEAPSIINGCQTITIAEGYLRFLEKKQDQDKLKRFNEIKVLCKIVIGTTDEELREITNSNNRQNPIEEWQLFSNDPIHIEIEYSLREIGIFYERQEGKFDALMKETTEVRRYPNTNQTFVKIEGLGQAICLCRQNLQWAAKPSEIFVSKKNHDSIFDKYASRNPGDIVVINNLMMAARRALSNYLSIPMHASNDATLKIFGKTIVKIYMYFVAVLYFYQTEEKASLIADYSRMLNKKAAKTLVDEFETFYRRIITKTKEWYLKESKNLSNTVSSKKLDDFLNGLCIELGINLKDGNLPFTEKAINWAELWEDDRTS